MKNIKPEKKKTVHKYHIKPHEILMSRFPGGAPMIMLRESEAKDRDSPGSEGSTNWAGTSGEPESHMGWW